MKSLQWKKFSLQNSDGDSCSWVFCSVSFLFPSSSPSEFFSSSELLKCKSWTGSLRIKCDWDEFFSSSSELESSSESLSKLNSLSLLILVFETIPVIGDISLYEELCFEWTTTSCKFKNLIIIIVQKMLTKNKCNDLINITLLFIFYSAKNSYTIAVVAKRSKI